MAIDWGAFVKGWAGSAADSMKERDKAEKDKKMREDLLALQEKYQIAQEDREVARGKKKVDVNRSSYDYATGEKVLVNEDGDEIGRVSDPTIGEDRQWAKEERELRRRQAEASIGASNRSGRGGSGGADSTTDKNRSRVETVLNNIDKRLEDMGAPAQERLDARRAVVQRVASGQSIDQAWLDRYESALLKDIGSTRKIDQWAPNRTNIGAAKAALAPK